MVAVVGVLLAAPASAVEYEFPEPTNYVVDVAGLFSQGALDVANAELRDYQERTGRQIAVAVVDYPEVTRDNEAEYAIELARAWGVGTEGRDDGVLLLIGTQGGPGNRALRVEVGRGLEGELTDVQSDEVQRAVQSLLQASRFDAALMAGQRLIRRELGDTTVPADVTAFDPGTGPVSTPIGTPSGGGGGFLLLLLFFLLFLYLSSRGRRRRRRRRRWHDDDYYGGGGGVFPVPIFIGGGGWGGGGFGGGGFGGGGFGGGGFGGGGGGFGGGGGGGFGGFGGGDFGGGGAGGGW